MTVLCTLISCMVMGLRLGPEECSRECKISSLHISGHWTENLKILSHLIQVHAKLVTGIKLVGNRQREHCSCVVCYTSPTHFGCMGDWFIGS